MVFCFFSRPLHGTSSRWTFFSHGRGGEAGILSHRPSRTDRHVFPVDAPIMKELLYREILYLMLCFLKSFAIKQIRVCSHF